MASNKSGKQTIKKIMGEEVKIKPTIEKYLVGEILDIGCGDSRVKVETYRTLDICGYFNFNRITTNV